MCGIFGAIGKIKPSNDDVIGTISHRGPDSSGHYKESDIFLAHTRLSIQDLTENANQPMSSSDGRYVIIFNGEIYNHGEIRKLLESDFNFRSSGDTETVLYGYIKYGVDLLSKLNGIFAFSIYDKQSNEIFIARDHFGVKPLYWYVDSQIFLFGSELKSFLAYEFNKEISIEALVNYIQFLWSPGEKTPYKYVKKLLPGNYFKFNIKNFKEVESFQFYKWEEAPVIDNLTEDQIVDTLEELLLNAVKRQMLSDVPVGFFLSGGLDSSLIVAMARKLYPDRKFLCFTIDTGNWSKGIDGFVDDLYYANKVAKELNVDLKVVKADVDIVQMFDHMIWHLDEPQADAAPLNVLNIAKLARQNGIKVLIGGTAGDDLFSGYRRHQALMYEKLIDKIPLGIRRVIKGIVNFFPSNIPFFRRVKKLLSGIDMLPTRRQLEYFSWLHVDAVKSLFTREYKYQISNYDSYNYFYYLEQQINKQQDYLARMLYWEVKTFLVDHNLNYTDKMSMAVGVEARVPFLDMELVQFSKIIPTCLKMKGQETKYILKKVAERYLPKEVIYRPKTGFGAPVRQWITNDLQPMIDERLSPERLRARGIFDEKKVWELIRANKEGRIDASYSIWSLLAIESWLNQFVDNKEEK